MSGVLRMMYTSDMYGHTFITMTSIVLTYCQQDSGHESDWEYVLLVYAKGNDGQWSKTRLIFEQDGASPSVNWTDLDTFDL
jgi:hypothetical protein